MSQLHEVREAMLDAFYIHNAGVPLMSTASTRVIDAGVTERRTVITVDEATFTLTPEMSGALIVTDDDAIAFTLPTLTAADVGIVFDVLIGVTASAVTITADAADPFIGGVVITSTTAGESDAFSAGNDDTILGMNGTTTGGIVGSTVRFTAIAADAWGVSGVLIGSGELETGFDAPE